MNNGLVLIHIIRRHKEAVELQADMAATNERIVEKIRHVEFFQSMNKIVREVVSYQFIYGHSLCSIRDTPMIAQQFSLPSSIKKRLRQSTIFPEKMISVNLRRQLRTLLMRRIERVSH